MLLQLALAAILAASSAQSAPAIATGPSFLRGMVVSCPRWGPIWGSPAMADSLEELEILGVNAVAIHPYGWLRNDGSVEFQAATELDFLAKAVDLAARSDLDLFWKPHIGYWGTDFSHRGAIRFERQPASWARFFRDYEAFIVDQAQFAEDAGIPILAVGVELEGTTHFEEAWRRIILAVRDVYTGRILYAANWDSLEKVPFWDAVDLIGVHAYFPLSGDPDPSREALARGWDAPLRQLERLSRHLDKPVLVAEIGYTESPDAARIPWAYRTVHTEEARRLRSRLIDVAISRLEEADFIEGMFWWKWMPGERRSRNFSMRDEAARDVIRSHWSPQPHRSTAK